jgi:hypothetical protein
MRLCYGAAGELGRAEMCGRENTFGGVNRFVIIPVDWISSKLRIDCSRNTAKKRQTKKRVRNKIGNAAVAAANEVKAAAFRTSLGQNLARTRIEKKG